MIGAALYERTSTRRDYRNGRYERGLVTGVGPVTLRVPRTRKGFTSLVFERNCRRQAELNRAIGEMFVKGASTAQVGEIIETLTGVKLSVSRPSAPARCSPFSLATVRMSWRGLIYCTTCNGAAFRAWASGSPMAIKRCSMPWRPSFRPRHASVASNTNSKTS